jgi:uncharacterized membrane protein YgdD (TMEM256/DUF423 family)
MNNEKRYSWRTARAVIIAFVLLLIATALGLRLFGVSPAQANTLTGTVLFIGVLVGISLSNRIRL